ncbi:NADH-quinone oxidoreductase subunit F [Thermoproteota archaeon]
MQILKKTNLKAYAKAIEIGHTGVIESLKNKGLTGRGGAAFPTGTKWEMVVNAPADMKYVICNADEGEPGTFKDKFILEHNPELVIEGIIIAAYAVHAEQAFIYLRGEYDYLEPKLKKVINDMLKKTKAKTKIDIILGAGAYVCGDETAIISSIEGYRGQPRHKPPFPTTNGLWGKPTVINNTETMANVPIALLFDDWDPHLRLYSLSGNVTKPGVYELPLGTRLCDLIEKGEPKNKIKAVYFGCFGGCLPHCEIELTPENVCGKDCMLGACTVIAVDEKQSMVDVATNIAKFYEFESCGKCTPCREGSMRILAILEKISIGNGTKKDLETLQELGEVIRDTSFCGLGQTATHHLLTALEYFKKEFEEKVK